VEVAVTAVALDKVEAELARLWTERGTGDTHLRTLDLVAFCATPDELPRVRAALAPMAAKRACRTLTVVCYPGEAPSITARVGLHVDTARKGEAVGDDVTLEVRGAARGWVSSALRQLRHGDLPMHLWWSGDLPDDDRLFDELTADADVTIVHSADMDLRDLEQLRRVLAWRTERAVFLDLNWVRLALWQELTARFFDDEGVAASIPRIDTITLGFAPREGTTDAAPTQAALLAGWIAVCTGWDVNGATWETDPFGVCTATVKRADGSPGRVRFLGDDRPGVYAGALHTVLMSGAGVKLEVARALEDPRAICWTGEVEGQCVPSQCVRSGVPDEPKMLARALDRPERDPLFERCLAAAAALTRAVAPLVGEGVAKGEVTG
jgi:glucose-6-phosphate dehydrogenase assembly protein OpcA